MEKWWYNTTYHTSIKMSLTEVHYGFPSTSISYFYKDKSKVQEIESHIEKTKETLTIHKEDLQLVQNMIK